MRVFVLSLALASVISLHEVAGRLHAPRYRHAEEQKEVETPASTKPTDILSPANTRKPKLSTITLTSVSTKLTTLTLSSATVNFWSTLTFYDQTFTIVAPEESKKGDEHRKHRGKTSTTTLGSSTLAPVKRDIDVDGPLSSLINDVVASARIWMASDDAASSSSDSGSASQYTSTSIGNATSLPLPNPMSSERATKGSSPEALSSENEPQPAQAIGAGVDDRHKHKHHPAKTTKTPGSETTPSVYSPLPYPNLGGSIVAIGDGLPYIHNSSGNCGTYIPEASTSITADCLYFDSQCGHGTVQ
jgi:hypothetical protein